MKKNYLICVGATAALAVVMIAVIGIGNKQDQSPETMDTDDQVVSVSDITDADDELTDTTIIEDETTAIESEATTVISVDISVPDIVANELKSEDTSNNDVVIDPEELIEVTVNITEPAQRPEPPEPPVVTEPETLKNPDVKPTYEEKKTTINNDSGRPKNGERKDGMIYIDGFGWIVDEGGGSAGQKIGNDGDTLTGNKVGEMG